MALPAFTRCTAVSCAAIDRQLLLGQTNRWTPNRCKDPAPHSMWAVSRAIVTSCHTAATKINSISVFHYTMYCMKAVWTHTHTHPFNGSFSGTTQVSRYQKGKPIWILLEQETVSGSGISWAICKSAPCSKQTPCQHPTTQFFTGRMPFLPPNQQRQSTESSKAVWSEL